MTTLFHYCSTSSFLPIILNKAIWLSSLTLSNDSLEGKILSDVLKRVTDRYDIDWQTKTVIHEQYKFFEDFFDGLGFCLSETGDLLSQWRGYADDGQGFSIGFTKEYLELLSNERDKDKPWFKLHKVIYNPEEQDMAIRPILDEIKSDVESGKLKIPIQNALLISNESIKSNAEEYEKSIRPLFIKLLSTVANMFALKSEAFSEEREWRLVSLMLRSQSDDCLFRYNRDRLIPYRQFKLIKLSDNIISDVIIGPKNITPIEIVNKLLILNGYDNVNVCRSKASYR